MGGKRKKPECHFENCKHYLDGHCQDAETRKFCVDMAVKMLCMDGYRMCDFCAGLRLAQSDNERHCENYNQRDKVGRAVPRYGVKYVTYLTDCWHYVDIKDSKIYHMKFCPVCGRQIKL